MDEKITELFEIPTVAKAYTHYFLHEDEAVALTAMGRKPTICRNLCRF